MVDSIERRKPHSGQSLGELRCSRSEIDQGPVQWFQTIRSATHTWMGLVEIWTRRASQGVVEMRACLGTRSKSRPLPISCDRVLGQSFLSAASEETEAHIAEALRLSPRDPGGNVWRPFTLGVAKRRRSAVTSRRSAGFSGRRGGTQIFRMPISSFLASGLAQLDRLYDASCGGKGRPLAQPGLHHVSRPRPLDMARPAATRRLWAGSDPYC